MVALALAIALTAQGATPGGVDVTRLVVSPPAIVVEIDAGKLKGSPARLSWSPQADQLYLQTREGEGPNARQRHYVISLAGRDVRSVDDEPGWASQYWQVKSAQAAPDAPALRITVSSEEKTVRATSAPMAGAMARGSPDSGATGTSAEEFGRASEQGQISTVWTLTLKGEWLGEWVNTAVVPGYTFGWAPVGRKAIVFVNRGGRLVLMDEAGRKKDLDATASALLPGWSHDGRSLAWLERTGRKKFVLKTATVEMPQ